MLFDALLQGAGAIALVWAKGRIGATKSGSNLRHG
jgi:hypothetical protein